MSAELIINRIKRKTATFFGLGVSVGMCFLLAFLLMLETDENK